MKAPLIPNHWTAGEALAVYEFIDALRDEIWSRYGFQLVELLREERSTNPADWNPAENSEDFDDELNF